MLERLTSTGMLAELRKRFVRTKEEVNKEAMVAARDTHRGALDMLGVEIVQTETFYLDPAREGQPDVRLAGDGKVVAA